MVKFRVQNYKNVDDTGWVNCGNLTCFVGKNESGKSAVFRGLSKINPSDKEKYNGLKEFPRKKYTVDFKKSDWPVSSVDFQLSDAEHEELKGMCSLLEKTTNVICTRHYSWKFDVDFVPSPSIPDVSFKKFSNLLKEWHSIAQETTAPDGMGAQLVSIKSAILNGLTDSTQKIKDKSQSDDKVDEALVNNLNNNISSQLTEDWRKKAFKKLLKSVNQFRNDIELIKQVEKAKQWVEEHIPKFLYFAEFNVIESAINMPDFIQRLTSNPTDPRLRATKCLFEHVGLNLNEVQKLDPTKPNIAVDESRKMADERSILMSSASTTMTQQFSGWWEQRTHKFRYQIDGPFFRVWVSDNLDPSDIELDQRSQGMQYFFSFYLVFLVEAEGVHSNTIILLDEPGLHLHGTAQQKIVKFLDKLSEKNQLLYSTHSPFMIDGDNLENVRVISEKEDGTVMVSENVWPRDEDALFPLQAGLGYAIVQTLFYSKRQVIVEGLTDYWILKAMNALLSKKGLATLRNDIVIVPCGGVSKLLPLASMLHGHNINVAILLDGDEPGKRKGKEAEEKLLAKCLFMDEYARQEKAEIEDLLPEKLYLDAVMEAYPDMKASLNFTQEEMQIKSIAKRTKAAFERMGKVFEKWGPSRVIVDWAQEKPDMFPDKSLAMFEAVCKALNKILQ